MPEEQLAAIRARFAKDFPFYAKHCLKIRTKDGTISPFVLNPVQLRLWAQVKAQLETTGKVRIIGLKARQQGFSTFVAALQTWWLTFHKAQKGLVLAHTADSTQALFDQYKRFYDNLPEAVKPATKYSSRHELVFSDLDSGMKVSTAGGKGVVRGDTITVMHLSEVAFWPETFAKSNFGGLIKAMPNAPGTLCFIESTANGMTGVFKDLWDGAVSGTNEFQPFFSAWHESAEYRRPVPAYFKRTPDEEKLADEFNLDDEQLVWRRFEIGRDGLDMFHQECPAFPDEAFLATGAPVFEPKLLHPLINPPREPVSRWLVGDGSIDRNSAGELHVFHDYEDPHTGLRSLTSPSEVYVIGADVGMGIRGKDYSVAQVLDSHGRQVASWRGYVHPDHFAKILNTLGLYYNGAMINVERNNHGLLTCVKLRDLYYPNLYTEVTEGALDDRESIAIGTYTTERNKPLIIDKLRAALRDGSIKILDPTTVREMLTYVVTQSGRMEADGDAHDDTVMALAHAWHIHDGVWTPCEIPESLYFTQPD